MEVNTRVNTQRYIRKPLYVEAVRVTAQNFDACVAWSEGEVQTDEVPGTGTTKKFIKVRVQNPKNARQTKAFINDWILYTDRGYKVYTNKAFRAAFDLVEESEPKANETPPAQSGENEKVEVATAKEIREKLPHAQDKRKELDTHLAGEVSQEVRPGDDLGTTPQGESIEVVEATPQAIADAVNAQPSVREGRVDSEAAIEQLVPPEESPQPEPVSQQPPQDAAAGKMVLSLEEQKELGPEEVRDLLSSGDVILAQDLAESA